LELVTRGAPEILDAWILLARAKETSGHPEEGIAVLRNAQRQFAANPALALADALMRSRHLDEAQAIATTAAAMEPVLAHELLARIALARGDSSAARKEA